MSGLVLDGSFLSDMYGAVLLSFDAAVPIRHLAVVAFRPIIRPEVCFFDTSHGGLELSAWKDSYGSLARVEYSMDGEEFTLCGRLPEDFSAVSGPTLPDQAGKSYSRCTRVHEIAIERNIVARHLRFVSHEGPIGLSQVFLNRDYNGYGHRYHSGLTVPLSQTAALHAGGE